MNKKLILLILALTSITVTWSQKPTNNPFSRFGIGQLMFQGFGRNIAMGHTGIASYDKFHYSLLNPASITSSGSQHVIFNFGLNFIGNQYQTADTSVYSNVSDISFISARFPITDWMAFSIGFQPYSAIGYDLQLEDTLYDNETGLKLTQIYDGSGGVHQIYFEHAIKIIHKISLGYTVYFRWGDFDRYAYMHSKEPAFEQHTNIFKTLINHGFSFNSGIIYSDTIYDASHKHDKFHFTLAATFSPKSYLKGMYTRSIIRRIYYYGNTFLDTISFDTIERYRLPIAQTFGLGASFTFHKSFTIELNYSQQNWKNLSILDQKGIFQNSQLFAFGLEYCRDPFSTRFFRRMRFRFGAYYQKDYLKLNNIPITQYGITFGLGIPTPSTIVNTSFELGTKGTTANGLFKENYILFNLDFTIHSIWFIRKKYL